MLNLDFWSDSDFGFRPTCFCWRGGAAFTRADCEEAGKTWDDTANVCGGSETTADRKKEKKKKKRGKHKKDQSRLKEGPPEADSP
jgi:hypothetical protein